jgi:3-deoxy-manno-octulosonate cytidylyltransferase (CMP-KDO synthetase)
LDYTILIPARLGSTRLPDKALADIAGVPMVVRTAMAATQTGARRVAVATDSQAIVDAVQEHGFDAIMTRADHPSGTDRLAEASTTLGLAPDDIVVNLQGDEPQMPGTVCDLVAQRLIDNPDESMATAVHPIADHNAFRDPNVVKAVLNARDQAIYFSRAPVPWGRDGENGWPQDPYARPWHHIGIYGYRVRFLTEYTGLAPAALERTEALEQLRAIWHGHAIGTVKLDASPPRGVDTPTDLERVRAAFSVS